MTGSGLIYLPVVHEGNQNASVEEAEAVAAVVASILESNARWINRLARCSPSLSMGSSS